jgi:hypothetical protein
MAREFKITVEDGPGVEEIAERLAERVSGILYDLFPVARDWRESMMFIAHHINKKVREDDVNATQGLKPG